ncbi:hypothetical protein FQA39_LY13638 [Lamprigera yunnana]|nr:hypothetical protein FQA39_LY13638 [Lamprigera yunnana]
MKPVVMTQDQLKTLLLGMRNILAGDTAAAPAAVTPINANDLRRKRIKGLSMLLDGLAATWYQGVKATITSWDDAIKALTYAFGFNKPSHQIFRKIFSKEQGEKEPTDVSVTSARGLLARLPPTSELHQTHQIDMIHGLLNRKIRQRLPRNDVKTFNDLIDKARSIEDSFAETSIKIVVFALFVTNNIECDWVKIPQTTNDPKMTKKSGYTLLMLTTTSTTMQTPIFAKPTQNKPKDTDDNFQESRVATTSFPEIRVLTTENSKKNTLPISSPNIKKNRRNSTFDKIDSVKKLLNSNTELKYRSFFEEANNEPIKEDYGYSYSTFIPFLSKIQSALMKNAHESKNSKVNVLADLRDHLLYEMKNRISNLWKPKENRIKRHYEDDLHMDFPSNESALMTIGFLTFAVFLIKLVMQVISATHTNTTTTGRKRREAFNDDTINILRQLEEFRWT